LSDEIEAQLAPFAKARSRRAPIRPCAAARPGSCRAAQRAPSNTRSSVPAGTCSRPVSCTTTSAATTSAAATPNAPPPGSSPNTNASDTTSPWRPPPLDVTRHFPSAERLEQLLDRQRRQRLDLRRAARAERDG